MEIKKKERELNNLFNSPIGKIAIEEMGDFITNSATAGMQAETLKGMCLMLAHIKELAKERI